MLDVGWCAIILKRSKGSWCLVGQCSVYVQTCHQTCILLLLFLYNIWRIRKYLSKSACETPINALVVSRLDYCNNLFYGHPAKLLSQLQRVQNSAARLIHQSTQYSPSSPLLQDLHWLPIKYRCIFKILLITFKAIHGHVPSYIQDLVKVKHQTRTLRSSTATYLDHPSIKLSNNLDERSFYIAAPTEWNRLPANIRNSPSLDVFKKRLKTHLFTKAFDTWLSFFFYTYIYTYAQIFLHNIHTCPHPTFDLIIISKVIRLSNIFNSGLLLS